MANAGQTKPVPEVLSDILSHVSNLMRKEVDLARSEVSQNLNQAGVAIGLLVAGVVIALTALNVLSAALVVALSDIGIAPAWASLIVGGALAVVAFAMVGKGLNDLKLSSIAPTRTVENVKKDADVLREQFND